MQTSVIKVFIFGDSVCAMVYISLTRLLVFTISLQAWGFVLDDGGEVDLDLGNYEHFLDIRLTKDNNLTTGKIYQSSLLNAKEII